jgi:enoyl-CoA hydratase/carnithine racemase
MSDGEVLYERDDRVALVTFNRPAVLNAITYDMIAQFVDALQQADADPDVRVVVVRGAGERAFSVGYDIARARDDPRAHRGIEEWREATLRDFRFCLSPWECSKPVIAMIRGYCLAGALELAQMCDVRIASSDARFGVVETRFSTGVAVMIMPWIVGSARARELVYTGDTIDAGEAHRIGLVNHVHPPERLEAETLKLARRMSMVALSCLQTNKRAINQTMEAMGFRSAMQYALEACVLLDASGTPEFRQFDRLRRERGLKDALAWRDGLFRPYE